MWRYDFHLFYLAGQAVLAGTSPYVISDFYAPYPLAVFFALFAWMPENVAYAIFVAGVLFMMWKLLRFKGVWALLSFPVLFSLFVGQIDLPLALAAGLFGPWALPLMLFKPQVGFVVAPWLLRRMTRRQWVIVGLLAAVILGLCFALRPQWLAEWWAATPVLTSYARRDSNLYWLVPSVYKNLAVAIGAVVGLAAGFLLWERKLSMTVLHLLAPLTNIYSVSVLAEWIGPVEMLLSWLIILLVGQIHSGAPNFILALSILGYHFYRRRFPAKTSGAAPTA
jgi:hypothetical protein